MYRFFVEFLELCAVARLQIIAAYIDATFSYSNVMGLKSAQPVSHCWLSLSVKPPPGILGSSRV